MPVATSQKVEALTHDFRSQRRLADALGVSPAQVSRWLRGQGIDPRNGERIDQLEFVVSQAERLFGPEGAQAWLFGIDRHLGDRRPIDMLRRGRVTEVLGALSAARAGSYA